MKVLSRLVVGLALGVVLCLPAVTNASVVLSDNLSKAVNGHENVTTTRWVTSSFGTDATSYFLDSVTLLMHEVTSGGAQAGIFTDSSFAPGTLVGTLTSPSSYPSSDANVTFTASGITLNSASTYWVVLKALSSGEYAWAWTEDNTGSGIGFQHTWGYSDDSGSIWYTFDAAPQMMKVEGSPVPVPPSLLLFGPGLFGLAALRRWRRG